MALDGEKSTGSGVLSTVLCVCCGRSVNAWKSYRCLECLGRFCEACMCLVAWRGPGFSGYGSSGMCRSCGGLICHHDMQASSLPAVLSGSPAPFVGREILPPSDVRLSSRFRRRLYPSEV